MTLSLTRPASLRPMPLPARRAWRPADSLDRPAGVHAGCARALVPDRRPGPPPTHRRRPWSSCRTEPGHGSHGEHGGVGGDVHPGDRGGDRERPAGDSAGALDQPSGVRRDRAAAAPGGPASQRHRHPVVSSARRDRPGLPTGRGLRGGRGAGDLRAALARDRRQARLRQGPLDLYGDRSWLPLRRCGEPGPRGRPCTSSRSHTDTACCETRPRRRRPRWPGAPRCRRRRRAWAPSTRGSSAASAPRGPWPGCAAGARRRRAGCRPRRPCALDRRLVRRARPALGRAPGPSCGWPSSCRRDPPATSAAAALCSSASAGSTGCSVWTSTWKRKPTASSLIDSIIAWNSS